MRRPNIFPLILNAQFSEKISLSLTRGLSLPAYQSSFVAANLLYSRNILSNEIYQPFGAYLAIEGKRTGRFGSLLPYAQHYSESSRAGDAGWCTGAFPGLFLMLFFLFY